MDDLFGTTGDRAETKGCSSNWRLHWIWGAILVAVYGSALAAAVAAIGVSGGIWGMIHAASENNTRVLREDKWVLRLGVTQGAQIPIV
jgi:hypothetical protein